MASCILLLPSISQDGIIPQVNAYLFLQHYAELPDIKRVIVNTHAIEPQVHFVEWLFFVCGMENMRLLMECGLL